MLHKTRLHKNVLGVSLLLFFCFFSVFFQAQNLGKPPVVNYTPKDYGKDRNVQNWTIIQNKQGLIFVGNDNCILVYDGNIWDFIPFVVG